MTSTLRCDAHGNAQSVAGHTPAVSAGLKAGKPWSLGPAVSVKKASQTVTASQTVHEHLNKVAWWLDLQASQHMTHLPGTQPCDIPLTAMSQHSGPPAELRPESFEALQSDSAAGNPNAKIAAARHSLAGSSLSPDQLAKACQEPKGSSQCLKGTKHSRKGIGQPSQDSKGQAEGSTRALQGNSNSQEEEAESSLLSLQDRMQGSLVTAAQARPLDVPEHTFYSNIALSGAATTATSAAEGNGNAVAAVNVGADLKSGWRGQDVGRANGGPNTARR